MRGITEEDSRRRPLKPPRPFRLPKAMQALRPTRLLRVTKPPKHTKLPRPTRPAKPIRFLKPRPRLRILPMGLRPRRTREARRNGRRTRTTSSRGHPWRRSSERKTRAPREPRRRKAPARFFRASKALWPLELRIGQPGSSDSFRIVDPCLRFECRSRCSPPGQIISLGCRRWRRSSRLVGRRQRISSIACLRPRSAGFRWGRCPSYLDRTSPGS